MIRTPWLSSSRRVPCSSFVLDGLDAGPQGDRVDVRPTRP